MELNQLRAFLEAARHEHMTRAAEAMHVTQPAMSRMIARLEEELGVRLFDREGRAIRLNEHGRAVLEHTERIFGELDAMRRHLDDLGSSVSGLVRVASSFPNREPDWLYDAIRGFLFAHPQVSFRIRQMSPQEIARALEERRVDLALTVPSVQSAQIVWTHLFSEKMGVLLPRSNPLCDRSALHVADLRGERFLCNNSNSDVYDLTRSFCAQAGFEPDIYYEGDSPQLIGEAISRGLGVSFIAQSHVPAGAAGQSWEQEIVFRPIADEFCCRVCGVAAARGQYETRAVRLFYQWLCEQAAQRTD